MQKLLLITNTSWNLFNFRLSLIKELDKNYDLFLVANKDKFKKFLPKNIKKINLKINASGINFFFEIKTIYQIYKIISKVKPDKIISFTPKINLYTSIVLKFFKLQQICVFTGLGNLFVQNKFIKFFAIISFKFFFKKNTLIIFQNKKDLNYFINKKIIKKLQAKLIKGSGINIKKFYFIKKKNTKKIKFLYIGRIIEDKGIKELLKSINLLKKNYTFDFTFVGNIDFKRISSETYKLFNLLKKKKYLTHISHSNESLKFISKSDFLVLPSYREGLSKSILESFAVGRVVLASDVPGCNDLIKHQYNGLLFKAKDYKSLAKAMIEAIHMNNFQKKAIIKRNIYKIKKYYKDEIINKKFLQVLKCK